MIAFYVLIAQEENITFILTYKEKKASNYGFLDMGSKDKSQFIHELNGNMN